VKYKDTIEALRGLGYVNPTYPLEKKFVVAETYMRHQATILKALQLAEAIEAAMAPDDVVHHYITPDDVVHHYITPP
jgi:hypothetical protein